MPVTRTTVPCYRYGSRYSVVVTVTTVTVPLVHQTRPGVRVSLNSVAMSFLQKQFGFSSIGIRPDYDSLDTLNLVWTPRTLKDPLQPHVSSVEPETQRTGEVKSVDQIDLARKGFCGIDFQVPLLDVLMELKDVASLM